MGVDSIFHMNRFYDAMMQIKTGNFSYFISIYGFQQSGRIVNALYGPLMAYLNGGLLLLMGSWFRFQIVSSFAIMVVSGINMYHLALRTNIQKGYALFVGLAYMVSYLIMGWVVGMQFTGWGAALLPWLLSAGFDMVDEKQIKIFHLALPMALLLQTHLLSSLAGALALVPLFISGLIQSRQPIKMLRNAALAVILTILLTMNVWTSMYQINLKNHVLAVAPQLNMHEDSISFWDSTAYVLPSWYAWGFIIVTVYFIWHFRQLSRDRRIIFGTGILFLWLSSVWFPWLTLEKWIPSLSYLIQMPRRFVVIAFVMLLICLGIMFNESSQYKVINHGKPYGMILIIFVLALNAGKLVQKGVRAYYAPEVVQNNYNLNYQTYSTHLIRDSLNQSNPGEILKLLTKATPDYLPVQYQMNAYNYFDYHPYGNYNKQIINYAGTMKKIINNNGHLVLQWFNHGKQDLWQQIPLVKYPETKIILNGHNTKNVKQTEIGSVIVKAKPGWNRIEVYYLAKTFLVFSIKVAIISWGLVTLWLVWQALLWFKIILKKRIS
jgi:hypothetical protein